MMRRFVAAVLPLLALLQPDLARAADKITLLTTGKGTAVDWPMLIAQAKGFFAAQGLSVDDIAVPSAGAAVQQVTAGSGDMASGGLTDPIRAIDHGGAIALLRLEAEVPPYSIWGKASVKDLADLRGRTVIVGGAKDITRIYFERMAGPNGLQPGAYDLVYAGTTAARYAALAAGSVDAAILYPPATFKAAAVGYRNLGELGSYVTDLPFSGFTVNRTWAMAHQDAARGFVRAINASTAWFDDPANRAAAIEVLIKASGADPADVAATYDYFKKIHVFPTNGAITGKTLSGLVAALASTGDLAGAADPDRFIDPVISRFAMPAS